MVRVSDRSWLRPSLFTTAAAAAMLVGGCAHRCHAAPIPGHRESHVATAGDIRVSDEPPALRAGHRHGRDEDECLPQWEYHGTAYLRDSCGRRRCVTISGTLRAATYDDARCAAKERLIDKVECQYPRARIRDTSLSVWRRCEPEEGFRWSFRFRW